MKEGTIDFDGTISVIRHSLNSIDMHSFNALIDEAEKTLRKGKKIIVSGLGKNVPICDKFVGSMVSMGLNANFLHTNSAIHGDMGMVKQEDLVIILSKSGATEESIYLAELLKKRKGVELWLLTFKQKSPLIEILGDDRAVVLDLEHEGDLWNIMPNNSTTLNLIVLQKLAMELAKRMKLDLIRDYKPNHPGGAIGAALRNE